MQTVKFTFRMMMIAGVIGAIGIWALHWELELTVQLAIAAIILILLLRFWINSKKKKADIQDTQPVNYGRRKDDKPVQGSTLKYRR